MKRNPTSSSLILLTIIFFLTSCAGMRRMQENIVGSKEKEPKAFVEKTDGQIIQADEVKLRSPLFGKSTIELNQETKIPLKEVAAYQNEYAYFRKTPAGFAPRFKKGLINMYVGTQTYTEFQSPSTNGGFGGTRTRTRYVYYIQKGNTGKVESFDPNIVESYVSDYAPAMEFMDVFRQTQKKASMWSIINTSAVFGGIILAATAGISKNSAGKEEVNALGYGGVGLFLGGIVNGFVNKIRKGKNYQNLEFAIDAYNGQVTRKKK